MGMLFGGWAREQGEDVKDAGGEGLYYKKEAENYRDSWVKEQEKLEELNRRLTKFYQALLEAEKAETISGEEAEYWKLQFQKTVYG